MAFGFGFALTAIAKAVGFSPSALFASGAQGAWYDPSDFSTMFQDSAGTIPITSPLEKPVGLMLDKSKGLVLGPELVTNGDFSLSGLTGWAGYLGGVGAVINNQFAVTASGGAYSGQDYSLTSLTSAGKWYVIKASLVSGTGRITFEDGASGDPSTPNVDYTGPKDFTFYVYRDNDVSATLRIRTAANGAASTWDNISVRELPGNYATQSTTTSRPTLSARYNLLTKTEDISNAAWTKQAGTTVNASPVADPNGALNAWFVTGNGTSGIYQAILGTVSLGQSTRSVYLRVQSGTATIGLTDPALSQGTTTCNVTTTWQRFTLTETTSPTTGYVGGLFLRNIPVGGIEVAWPDVRPTNDGIGLPAYQRVNTATDYDYAGFPPYLKFDGTDDSMVTGSIDFTATDKMSVFAGVRKLSDAATGIVAEFSDSTAATGWFGLYASSGAAANYVARTKGSTENVRIYTTYTSPITNVVTAGMTTVAADSASAIAFRVNGADVSGASVASNISTGNYGTYPLYIGRRGGTSNPFNGRLYSLIVTGKLASAAEITATEAYINQKTRAY